MHRRAPRERQRGGCEKINIIGKTNQGSRGDSDHLGEPSVALHSQKLAFETKRLLSARAKFALPAKQIGLHGDPLALTPARDATADGRDFTRDFASRNSRQRERNGQLPFLKPQIKVVKAAGPNANNHFVGGSNRPGKIAVVEVARRAVSDKLHRFHTG
jgi:hypothetical protein